MSGTLYICGTPIGNLEDISLRVLRTLREVDLIAAEDTRHSAKLLNHYEIKTHITSYHEHNKFEKGKFILNTLSGGKSVALISDAGMPGISDPGEDLIRLCYENNIKVTTAPGPTAVITALVLSGLSTRRYVFEGFLSTDKKEQGDIFDSLANETRTIVFYEAPHRLIKTLKIIYEKLGDRKVSLVRELTKQYEEVRIGKISDILDHFSIEKPRGEFVLIIEGRDILEIKSIEKDNWNKISIDEHMEIYLNKNFSKKESMKLVAKDRGVSKREIYNNFISS